MWIDEKDYGGPCRRRRKAVRLVNRRRSETGAAEPPGNRALLRQLHAQLFSDLHGEALDRFRERLGHISDVLTRRGEVTSARLVKSAAALVEGRPGAAAKRDMEDLLRRAAEELVR